MTPEQARALADTAREHLAAIGAPWCADWLYEAIRHVCRNVDIECEVHTEDDCAGPGRYDGPSITRTQELLAELIGAVDTLSATP